MPPLAVLTLSSYCFPVRYLWCPYSWLYPSFLLQSRAKSHNFSFWGKELLLCNVTYAKQSGFLHVRLRYCIRFCYGTKYKKTCSYTNMNQSHRVKKLLLKQKALRRKMKRKCPRLESIRSVSNVSVAVAVDSLSWHEGKLKEQKWNNWTYVL